MMAMIIMIITLSDSNRKIVKNASAPDCLCLSIIESFPESWCTSTPEHWSRVDVMMIADVL